MYHEIQKKKKKKNHIFIYYVLKFTNQIYCQISFLYRKICISVVFSFFFVICV
jgi:hypothetical protein